MEYRNQKGKKHAEFLRLKPLQTHTLRQNPDLDMPVLIHDQVAALEVAVYDGRAMGVQVQHSTRRLGGKPETKRTQNKNKLTT